MREGLKSIRHNSKKNTTPRTVNLFLIVNEEGDQHYCDIPKFSKLYHRTRKNRCMDHICERSIHRIIFQNFKIYDAHLIIKHVIDKFEHWLLSCIPQATEKFMTLHG